MTSIIKNKKKIFRIRRNNINWLNNSNSTDRFKQISIKQHTWNIANLNSKFKESIFFTVYDLHYNSWYILNNMNVFTKFVSFYLTYCNNLTKRFEKKKLNQSNINLVVVSTPQTQVFFTIIKNKPILIFTPGVIRVVMKLIEKCSKKRKAVLLNCIKFLWLSSKNIHVGPIKLKISRNIQILSKIFSGSFNKNRNKIEYIYYEPKLNFGLQNCNKRASIKKNLRKKKKYINE